MALSPDLEEAVLCLHREGKLVYDDGNWLDRDDTSSDDDAISSVPFDDVRHVARLRQGKAANQGGAWFMSDKWGRVSHEDKIERRRQKQEKLARSTQGQLWQLLKFVPGALEDLVRGIYREERDREGRVIRIYQDRPDLGAIKLVMERTLGRAPLNVNISGTVEHQVNINDFSLEERRELLLMAAEGLDDVIDGQVRELGNDAG